MFYPFFVNPKDCTVSLEKTKTHFIEVLPKRPTGEEGRWTWSKEKVIKSISLLTGKKVNRKDADNFYDIFRMDFLEDDNGNEAMSKPKTIWIEKELNYQNGRTEIKEIFGDKVEIRICREMTKKFEEVRREKVSKAIEHFSKGRILGEFIIMFNPKNS